MPISAEGRTVGWDAEGEDVSSRLRPTLIDALEGTPTMTNGTAYLLIYNAVKPEGGLLHGRLHLGREHCAIGNYFTKQPNTALPYELIDEVAAVNDSVPNATPQQRKMVVLRWLKWKLANFGMPGFKAPKAAR